jgi:lipid-A-disaccharide synthase-like uncharacterized protein
LTAPPTLAFQAWDAVGWFGQAVFAWRILHQWIASERARRSVVPTAFWIWSLVGTTALLVYSLHRRDPVFLVGFLVNGFIYLRNLRLALRTPGAAPQGSPLPAVLLGVAAFTAAALWGVIHERELVRFDASPVWLAVGFAGQAIWSSRFVLQWWASERAGRSVLPESFFWASLAGCGLLLAYAIHRLDWVLMAAFALNPVPYLRNIVLLRRERAGGPGAAGAPR